MPEFKYRFSLITCTIGRSDDLDKLLESLSAQTFYNFECIIVDQNNDDRLLPILNNYHEKFRILHIKNPIRGLSVNRNLGLRYASGEIIAFPDDDCLYPPDTLLSIDHLFRETNYDIITCNYRDRSGKTKHPVQEKELNRYNLIPYTNSNVIFIKKGGRKQLSFDEKLGVGAQFGAGEESDFISGLYDDGYTIFYQGNIHVIHEIDVPMDLKRIYHYSRGHGALMKKEIIFRKKYILLFPFLKDLLKSFLGSILFLHKRKIYYNIVRGRLEGFFYYKQENTDA